MTIRSWIIASAIVAIAAFGFKAHLDLETRYNATEEPTVEEQKPTIHEKVSDIVQREGSMKREKSDLIARTIIDSAQRHRIPPEIILSIIFHESRFNHKAINLNDGIGLMQVVSSVHRVPISVLLDPVKNIEIGTKILKGYAVKSRSMKETLNRYNGSFSGAYSSKILAKAEAYKTELSEV